MAYDQNGARLGAAGHFASRITAALITAGKVDSEEMAADVFADLTSKCLDVINGLEGAAPPARSIAAVIERELPGATEIPQELAELRIINPINDDHPAWLYEQAKQAGVVAVWDNRDGLKENSKRPWYKQAEPESDDPKPFWPPKPRARR
jgi:hypothetical protein